MRYFFLAVLMSSAVFISPVFANQPEKTAHYPSTISAPVFVCFTPQQKCASHLLSLINQAKKNIYVQAYAFTYRDIAKALVAARDRGVLVSVILDKSQFKRGHDRVEKFFRMNKIKLWKDDKLNIAHNKVMIVDDRWVETGSFNFTYSAQYYNAENMLIIDSRPIAALYLQNWQVAKKRSSVVE